MREGGTSLIAMRSPEGEEYPAYGVYLEVVKSSRLVINDAFTEAWKPSDKPFMLVKVTFEVQTALTKYTARVQH